MMNKKAIFLSMLCAVSLVSFDATAFPSFKSVISVLSSRPVRYAAGVAGMAIAGYVGLKAYRWFRPAQQNPVMEVVNSIPPRPEIVSEVPTLRDDSGSSSVSTNSRLVQRGKQKHATFADRPVRPRPRVFRRTQSVAVFDRVRLAREVFAQREDLKLALPSEDTSLQGIYNAASTGTVQEVRCAFLAANMSLNQQSNPQVEAILIGALHCAVERNNLPVVKFILEEKHIAVDSKDGSKNTPLHRAKSPEMIRYLLSQGAKILENMHRSGSTIFHLVATEPELMDALIGGLTSRGQQANIRLSLIKCNTSGFNPLMLAFKENDTGYIRKLLTFVNEDCLHNQRAGTTGDSLLHIAVTVGNPELVRMLVEDFGFEDLINLQNGETGETALHLALEHKQFDIAQYFINKGVRIDLTNRILQTARDIEGFDQLDLRDYSPVALPPSPVEGLVSDGLIRDQLNNQAHLAAQFTDGDDSDDEWGTVRTPYSGNNAASGTTAFFQQLAKPVEGDGGTFVAH